MITGKTKSGFKYEIDPKRLDDYEFFELIASLDNNPLALPQVVNKLLGDDQKKRLMDHLRDENGVVPISKIEKEITDIFSGAKEVKNS